jgi:ribosomal subunit interface protein
MTLSWNIVAKNIHPHDQLQQRLREKVSKLERFLQHFPPDAVHLQVALTRQVKNAQFVVALTLRVPSNVLHAEKTASDPVPALDQAVKALLRELGSLKSALRHEAQWRQRARGQEQPTRKRLRFAEAPLLPGQGPQSLGEIVRGMAEQHYTHLLYHVRSQIWRAETEGAIPQHAIDAEAVADEVVRQACSRPESKPVGQTYRLWLFSLARRELEMRFRDLQERALRSVPLDDPDALLQSRSGESDDGGEALAEGDRTLNGEDFQTEDIVPDGHNLSPDDAAAESDLVEYLRRSAQQWPRQEGDIFQLYFLEGFELDEVAMLEQLTIPEVRKLIGQVQSRLRQVLAEAALGRRSGGGAVARSLEPGSTNGSSRGK